MDHDCFDALAKRTGTFITRRGLGLLALFGATAGVEDAAAKPKKCKKNQKKCGKRCVPKARCCAREDCDAETGRICQNGTCVCPPGRRLCDGVCRIPNADCCANADCPGPGGFCFTDGCGCVGAGVRFCNNRCLRPEECCNDLECGDVPNQVCGPDRACVCAAGFKRCAGACIPNARCCRDGDCPATEVCADGQCIVGAGTCPFGVDACSQGLAITCNTTTGQNCTCFVDAASRLRCGFAAGGGGGCTTDRDCTDFGAGAFCTPSGPNCDPTFCVTPCARENPDQTRTVSASDVA